MEFQTIQQTEAALKTHKTKGLSQEEARKRLALQGPNELAQEKKKGLAASLMDQLKDPLILILFAAAAISILLGEISDAAIIAAVVTLNAIVGLIQEGKAKKALDSLKKLTCPKAMVIRDGIQQEIQARELVPGDLVCLDAGRQVPADLRLTETIHLQIEESALTGESLPVTKDASFSSTKKLALSDCKSLAYMSTNVTSGRGFGMVIRTGMKTEIGKIASMIDRTPAETTPLQKRLADLGKLLSILTVILCVSLFAIAVLQKRDILEMLITAISLAVAAVPEGLPAVVTIVLALGVSKMVQVHTIVRRLPSVETLGAVNVVCSDKTGTLTQNKMKVVSCYTNQQFAAPEHLSLTNSREFLECLTLCNDASISPKGEFGDPTELALLHLARRLDISQEQLNRLCPRINEKSFDSVRKRMTTVHKKESGSISYTKGAADEILKRCSTILLNKRICPLTAAHKKQIQIAMEEMSSQALRVLAMAMGREDTSLKEQDMTFLGLTGMIDPPRPEAAKAVRSFQAAGVDTIMITGDHADTALAIARQLGIASQMSQCMTGLQLERLTDQELKERLPHIRVFARVAPEHKVRIVQALKETGKIAAMTGDGVNDAPSLKTADIGIAMGMNGTDVAKNAADMILTDDNFATIEKAICQGRGIYENIKKSILFLLSSNFGEVITMFFTILAGVASPLKPSHILWINLITDSLPALALGVDDNDKDALMKEPPRDPKESLFAKGGLTCTLFYGALIAGISLTAFFLLPLGLLKAMDLPVTLTNLSMTLKSPTLLNRAQTYAFTVLGLSQLFHAIGMRDVRKSFFRMNHLSNKLMILAFFGGFALQIAVTEIPWLIGIFGAAALSLTEWLRLTLLASAPLLAHELLVLLQPKAKPAPAPEKNAALTKA